MFLVNFPLKGNLPGNTGRQVPTMMWRSGMAVENHHVQWEPHLQLDMDEGFSIAKLDCERKPPTNPQNVGRFRPWQHPVRHGLCLGPQNQHTYAHANGHINTYYVSTWVICMHICVYIYVHVHIIYTHILLYIQHLHQYMYTYNIIYIYIWIDI